MMIRNMRVSVAFVLLIAGLGSPARAQTFKVPFTQFRLDNGLRVVVSEDHTAPVVAVAVYYDVGSRNEAQGRSGFAHLFEHMMFQGSENVGKAEHFVYVEKNGGYLNGSTHADFTNYYQFLPANQLELALWLESDRMRSLKITPANLRNQQEAVKEEKRLSIDNQAYWPALNRMDEMIFRNWANSHSTIGSMRDLNAATIADVRRFFDTYYAPNNAVLVIVGDVEPASAERLARKYFGPIPARKAPPPVDVSEPFEVVRRKSVVTDAQAQMPAVALAWKIPARRDPDFYPLVLLKSILSDGESSRLYRRLLKEKAISLEIQGFMDERRGPGSFTLFSIYKPEKTPEQVQAEVEAEVELIKNYGVTEDELLKARNQFRLEQFLGGDDESEYESLQTALGRALALGEYALFDGDPSLINTELDRYLSVTREQIREAARKYLGTKNRSVLYIRPASPEPARPGNKKRASRGKGD
ncbi:MAG TPA: pitrilysin family protein [Blastocatellia bacterium]|nr:pitrilysin family protein [Blastocatellia bacterium]